MITIEMLKSWNPCASGFKRFCELYPAGADLKAAADGLLKDGHPDWGLWLYDKAREHNLFQEITILGFANSGNWNSGNRNSGDWNSGNWNSGDCNSGNCNSGDWNSGDCNSGNCNSGNRNSGNWNSGNRNSGDWNSGDWNSGYFNSTTPDTILVFNKLCSLKKFSEVTLPNFLYFELTYWVDESELTDAEKADDPNFFIRGGQLRKKDYKTAFKESWDKANPSDRERIRDMPNFDAKIFFEISGIDLS